MTIKETYNFLTSVRRTEAEIVKLTIRHDELQTCLLPGAIRYDGDRVQTSPDDKMGKIAAEVVDLEAEIRDAKIRKAEQVRQVEEAISTLEDEDEQMVLLAFYGGRIPMSRVADMIHYTPRTAYRIRRRAVQHLAENLSQKSKPENL